MLEPIDRQAALAEIDDTIAGSLNRPEDVYIDKGLMMARTLIEKLPTIETEVQHGEGCPYCEGRSYSKKPLTVITRTMKRVEVVFQYCPACGRKMDGGADNDDIL